MDNLHPMYKWTSFKRNFITSMEQPTSDDTHVTAYIQQLLAEQQCIDIEIPTSSRNQGPAGSPEP